VRERGETLEEVGVLLVGVLVDAGEDWIRGGWRFFDLDSRAIVQLVAGGRELAPTWSCFSSLSTS